MTNHTFISYGKPDIEHATRLAADLTRLGIDVWLDKDRLLPGQRWRDEITSAIRNSKFFLVLLSTRSVTRRGYVQAEIGEALDVLAQMPPGGIFLIPARLDECQPSHPQLLDLQWVDLFPDWQSGLRKIASAAGVAHPNISVDSQGKDDISDVLDAAWTSKAGNIAEALAKRIREIGDKHARVDDFMRHLQFFLGAELDEAEEAIARLEQEKAAAEGELNDPARWAGAAFKSISFAYMESDMRKKRQILRAMQRELSQLPEAASDIPEIVQRLTHLCEWALQ
jgi:hypothetical protein